MVTAPVGEVSLRAVLWIHWVLTGTFDRLFFRASKKKLLGPVVPKVVVLH